MWRRPAVVSTRKGHAELNCESGWQGLLGTSLASRKIRALIPGLSCQQSQVDAEAESSGYQPADQERVAGQRSKLRIWRDILKEE